jgi:hypothetical protein
MGVVYRARQLGLDRVVAVKVISPERVEDPTVRARFLHEARAAAAVEHPNVLPVYGAGVDDGRAYLVMRHVPGQDLRTLVRTEGPLELARAAEICLTVGEALDAIHAAGYVHRDVKPANVLIDPGGHVYLSDFGLAKHALTTGGMTATDRWVGTLDFAAPEQIRGEEVDARTDVYALGAVLFFMLCGRVPFERDSDPARLFAHLSEEPPRPSTLRPGLPAGMDAVIARALAKDPDERYASAGELGRAACVAAGRPDLSGSATRISRPPRRRRRRVPRGLALGALLALLLAGAVAIVVATRGDEPAPHARAAPSATPQPTGPDRKDVGGLGHQLRGVAVADGDVWVINRKRDRVLRFDAETMDPKPGPQIGRGAWAIAADGDHLWVAVPERGVVLRIDARSGQVVGRIKPGTTPVGLAVDPAGVWITGRSINVNLRPPEVATPDKLLHYARNGALIKTVEVASGVRATTFGGGVLWVSLWDQTVLLKMSPNGAHLNRVGLTEPSDWLVYARGRVWASLTTALARLDARTGAHITINPGAEPQQGAVLGGKLYVAVRTEHELAVTDARNGTRAAAEDRIAVPLNPYVVTAGEGAIWVAGTGRGTLTRIRP